MSTPKITRRAMLKLCGLALLGGALGACAPAPQPAPTQAPAGEAAEAVKATEAPTAAAAAPAAKEIRLLLDGGGLTPTDPNAKLEEGQKPKVVGQKLADMYREQHPNVTIEWYRLPPGTTMLEWLQARMTARDCPDTFWMNTEDLWPHISKGWVLTFDEYLAMANPYASDVPTWKDQFLPVAIKSQTGPDGKSYGVNLDGAAVNTLYNKDAFADAGITTTPKTWADFMDVWQKLKDKGYIPYGGDLDPDNCCYYHWVDCLIYTQLLWSQLPKLDDDRNDVLTTSEVVLHSQKGEFPDWEAFVRLAHCFRDQVPYLPLGYEGHVDYRQLFRQGKVVMYMEGSWTIPTFNQDPPPFEYGWLEFPIITKDMWPEAPEKKIRIQGAWGSLQYHIPAYLAQTDPDKIPVIMDWLMFLSKPDNVTFALTEVSSLPLVKGAKGGIPGFDSFLEPYDMDIAWVGWNSLSGSARYAEAKLWQTYMPSQMSDDELLSLAQKIWDEELKKVLESNPEWKI